MKKLTKLATLVWEDGNKFSEEEKGKIKADYSNW